MAGPNNRIDGMSVLLYLSERFHVLLDPTPEIYSTTYICYYAKQTAVNVENDGLLAAQDVTQRRIVKIKSQVMKSMYIEQFGSGAGG